MSDATVLRLRPSGLEWREVEGEVLMLDLDSSEYFSVNPVGALLWPSLVEGTNHASLVSVLTGRYPSADPAVLEADVSRFLADLLARDLLDA